MPKALLPAKPHKAAQEPSGAPETQKGSNDTPTAENGSERAVPPIPALSWVEDITILEGKGTLEAEYWQLVMADAERRSHQTALTSGKCEATELLPRTEFVLQQQALVLSMAGDILPELEQAWKDAKGNPEERTVIAGRGKGIRALHKELEELITYDETD